MKTTQILSVAALAVAFSLANLAMAVEQPAYPKAEVQKVVTQSGGTDVDLVRGQPMIGKATPAPKVTSGSSQKDPDLLRCVQMGKNTCTDVTMKSGSCCKKGMDMEKK